MVIRFCPSSSPIITWDILQEAEEGAETAIDPGGRVISGTPPTNQAVDDEGGGQTAVTEAGGDAVAASEQEAVEDIGARRLSLQAAGGVAEEQEGEETKPHKDAGSVDSEQVTAETDREEGKVVLKESFRVPYIIFTMLTLKSFCLLNVFCVQVPMSTATL